MSEVLELTLPYPMSVNHYYGRRKDGGVFLKSEVKTYRRNVKLLVLQSLSIKLRSCLPLKADLKVTVLVYPPDAGKRDIDNIFKCLFDAMTKAGVYKDDRQIKHVETKFAGVVKGGKVDVRIEEGAGNE